MHLERLEKPLSILSKAKFKKVSTAYKIDTILNLLEPHYRAIYKAKTTMANQYGKPSEKEEGFFDILPEKREEFFKEFQEFLDSPVGDEALEQSIKKLTIDELEDMETPDTPHFKFDVEFIDAIRVILKPES